MSKILILLIFVSIIGGIIYYFNSNSMKTSTQHAQKITSHSGTLKKAYFAGGCFWCMEGIFEAQPGVSEAIAGYAGGSLEDATYEKVGAGKTKHRESVEVIYDPSVIGYPELVKIYFTQIDPTQVGGQFADTGYQYTTAIYPSNSDERQIATDYIIALNTSKKFDTPIAVVVEDFTTFFPAEEYHQDYYKKSAFRYNLYKEGSGRGNYIKKTWGKEIASLTEDELKSKLTGIQYKVTQEDGTEAPFKNPYWDNHEAGIYVDIVDGSPLFASFDKFDSGTGWPSFTRVMTGASVIEKTDTQLFSTRTEVRSKNANSHLGHVFNDGPVDKGGMRYCINSAALRFIPVADLEKEGYGEYVQYFDKK